MKLLKNIISNGIPVFIMLLLVFALRWFIFDWNTGVITAIYQLKTPLDGTNPGLIVEFCEKCLPVPIVVAIGTVFLKLHIKDIKNIQYLPSVIIFVCMIIVLAELKYLELDKYLINQSKRDSLFEEKYVKTDPQMIKGGNRNLILIYAESMEITYASREDGGGKPCNLIPDLTKYMKNEISFSDGDRLGGCKTMPGTDWTMGGIFSTMTGTPLKLDLTAPDIDLNKSFCPSVTAIGDVLACNGYDNYFQCGSDATFGGRKAFFVQHGDYHIFDYYYAVDKQYIPQNYHVFWGYEDRVLFDIAKKELSTIGSDYLEKGKKFNYTMLTVDTHHPAGYRCQLCERTYDDEFADIISCSDRQISNFIEWIESQAWARDTVIVVLGDHPSMVAGFWEDTDNYENKPINLFINSGFNYLEAIKREKNRNFTHFDFAPTILEAMGFEVPNHKIGLGVSLLYNEETLIEEMGEGALKDELCKSSRYYNDRILK